MVGEGKEESGEGEEGDGDGDGDDDKPYVSGEEVRRGLGMLVEHECRMCGSVPLRGGGWLTMNYVSGGVCPGICPEARYERVESS